MEYVESAHRYVFFPSWRNHSTWVRVQRGGNWECKFCGNERSFCWLAARLQPKYELCINAGRSSRDADIKLQFDIGRNNLPVDAHKRRTRGIVADERQQRCDTPDRRYMELFAAS